MALALAATTAISVTIARSRDDGREPKPLPVLSLHPPQCCAELVGTANGRTAVLWGEVEGRDAGLRVAFLRDRRWGPSIRIRGSSRHRDQTVQGMLSDGRVVVVWEPSPPEPEGTIRAAVVAPGGEVTTQTLFTESRVLTLGTLAPLAVGRRRALVAWDWYDGNASHISVAEWDGRRWTTRALQDDPLPQPAPPSVAVDARGNALVVWWPASYSLGEAVATPVRAAHRPAGARWPVPTTIARLRPDRVDVLAQPAATFADGRAVVSWATPFRGVPVKLSARALTGGRWRTSAPPRMPRTIAIFPPTPREGTLAVVTDRGAAQHLTQVPFRARLLVAGERVAFIWTELPSAPHDLSPQRVSYSELEHDGFSGPYGVGVESTSEASALLRPDGTLLVAYVGETGVFTVTREAGYGWRTPVSVSP